MESNFRMSLGEGNTPLIPSRTLGPALGLRNLFFKLEQLNPSGSYKDRFAAAAVSDLLRRGASVCLATSSGNTGAALAAYCGAAGIPCMLVIVDGAPEGKLRQMRAYGARTLLVRGFGKDLRVTNEVMKGLEGLAREFNSPVQISAYRTSPMGMAGVQTIAYEIAGDLPAGNKKIFSPAGGGGLTLAVAAGFRVWKKAYPAFDPATVNCVQPVGNDTISGPLRAGAGRAKAIPDSTTAISGLQVPAILDGDEVIAACRASGGTGYVVRDERVYRCQAELAQKEGIFCEPAGAVALAGVMEAAGAGELDPEEPVVCLVTGHGFKDPVSADRIAEGVEGMYFGQWDEAYEFIKYKL